MSSCGTRGGSPLADLDVRGLLRTLANEAADFVVIGGIAAVFHGSARLTGGLDITFAQELENLERLARALVPLRPLSRGAEDADAFVLDAATLRRIEVLTLATRMGDIDLLLRPAGMTHYTALRERAQRLAIDDFRVRIAHIEDLIAMKRAAGREKDRADVAELEAILRLRGS